MDVWTCLAVLGIAAIAVGVGMYSLPAGVIAGGISLLLVATAGAARVHLATRRDRPKEPAE